MAIPGINDNKCIAEGTLVPFIILEQRGLDEAAADLSCPVSSRHADFNNRFANSLKGGEASREPTPKS